MADSGLQSRLLEFYHEINDRHFEQLLHPIPRLLWNSRLRSSSGRFVPGPIHFFGRTPHIEIATQLLDEPNAEFLVRDTLGHEMIHYWLWLNGWPHGHTPLFYKKMREMGVSRYSSAPKRHLPRFVYECPNCARRHETRRRLKGHACLRCCRDYSKGVYDSRFRLRLKQDRVEDR